MRKGRATVYDYDEEDRLIRKHRRGGTEIWEYDSSRLTLYTDERRNNPLLSTRYTYGADFKLESRVESEGDETV